MPTAPLTTMAHTSRTAIAILSWPNQLRWKKSTGKAIVVDGEKGPAPKPAR